MVRVAEPHSVVLLFISLTLHRPHQTTWTGFTIIASWKAAVWQGLGEVVVCSSWRDVRRRRRIASTVAQVSQLWATHRQLPIWARVRRSERIRRGSDQERQVQGWMIAISSIPQMILAITCSLSCRAELWRSLPRTVFAACLEIRIGTRLAIVI